MTDDPGPAPRSDLRRRVRQLVVEALYEAETSSHEAGDVLRRRLEESAGEEPGLREPRWERIGREMLDGVERRKPEADALIVDSAPRYPLHTMAVVDRNILRLAIWELLTDARAPEGAVVNEAVELAHRYSGGNSPAFINGVLRTISQRIRAGREERVNNAGDPRDPTPEES